MPDLFAILACVLALAVIAGRGSIASAIASVAWMIASATLLIALGRSHGVPTLVAMLVSAAALGVAALGSRPVFAVDLAPEARGAAVLMLASGGLLYASAMRAIARSGAMTTNRIVRTGLYSLVRHPAYLGSALVFAGSGLAFGTWPVAVAYAALLAPLLARTIKEDRELRMSEEYRRYAAAVRWRLLPRIW